MPKKDFNQIAFSVVQKATGQEPETKEVKKNLAAVSLGRLGGLKGGKARAAKLSSAERSEIAKRAAKTRWEKKLATVESSK